MVAPGERLAVRSTAPMVKLERQCAPVPVEAAAQEVQLWLAMAVTVVFPAAVAEAAEEPATITPLGTAVPVPVAKFG